MFYDIHYKFILNNSYLANIDKYLDQMIGLCFYIINLCYLKRT
jgi:hypothetical protein